ncbi:signal recognition particle protein [Rubinisphaera sp.]|uniref:signal recognition particle protein n=1 Tax=Rubinisphaera sp. TaxID=2024857 RepID=UPI000C0DC97C|nr:signal recognition particle protein [Rubinisphaera sp.]MBV09210.1 signal recognition particle protein [Rubinisphaera sp.]HCS53734.1 signal recognition particle protein [Planctomycetaceae bacterium]|tara:strand:+ start:1841 stop:3328 length:1488 start_codon:yes stop_codon:yes gene_type:complete
MFESITKSLGSALGNLQRGRINEANIQEAIQEIKQALLEADVSYDVVDEFIKTVTQQSLGEKVLKSLKPGEQIVGIVHQELINLMGPVDHSLHMRKSGISIIMMCGLQGSGKTTTCAKLAKMLLAEGRKPMLVAADLQRPGAIEQLKTVGAQVGVPVHAEDPKGNNPVKVCQNGVAAAKKTSSVDTVILDTAGRLHVDAELMKELALIDRKLSPDQVLLVTDAMTGQDAVRSAKAFNEALELDGAILTKLDGDTRGGAALSVKQVTGVPIKFIGVGEQLDKLELFHPDRMASRILGMGDIVSLVEKAQMQFDAEEMEKQQERMAKGKFTLDDFHKQMKQIKKLGSMGEIMKMIPGMGGMADMMAQTDGMNPDKEIGRMEAMISSMTPQERQNPNLIDRSRRNRIARGCGSEPGAVGNLVKQFNDMAGMMQKMAGMGVRDKMRAVQELSKMGMADPGGRITDKKLRSKRGPADEKKLQQMKKDKRKQARKSRKKNR